MSRSFISFARWVKTRNPSEQTFSVVVRSDAAGSRGLDISTAIASRIRFASRPDDLAGISAIPSSSFRLDSTRLGGAKQFE